jgi:2-oxo-4-hydroxy-4-carboxy-5-ureidoimidazoline decarboxylase
MSKILQRWNHLSPQDAALEILACCASKAWAQGVAARRPLADESALITVSDEVWTKLTAQDWKEAFASHPRIGERKAPRIATARSATWSAQEQQKVAMAGESVQLALAEENREYEKRFHSVFIVCAIGKSAPEILEILRRRLSNDEATELREAVEEQRKITNLRLKKWLSE